MVFDFTKIVLNKKVIFYIIFHAQSKNVSNNYSTVFPNTQIFLAQRCIITVMYTPTTNEQGYICTHHNTLRPRVVSLAKQCPPLLVFLSSSVYIPSLFCPLQVKTTSARNETSSSYGNCYLLTACILSLSRLFITYFVS